MSSLRSFDLTAIPAWPTRATLDGNAPVLLWVVAGSASAALDSGHWRLAAGEALWIPAGRRAQVRGASDSCVLPIRVRSADRAAGPTAPTRVTVPARSRDALLAAFMRSLGVLRGGGVRATAILAWIGHGCPVAQPPALPRSPELRRVAEELLEDPSRSPAEIGASHGMGGSVLARRFRAETGWTPVRWRARHVLARAAERILVDGSVAAGVAGTAYGSPQAFARAFRREWGATPGDLLRDHPTPAPVDRRVAVLGPQCNGYHVVVWVASGTARLEIDGAEEPLRTGDIACLPAGSTVALRADAGSAVMPIGWLPGGCELGRGVVSRVGPEAHETLIRLAAWEYPGVEPLGAGEARAALQTALGVDDPVSLDPETARAAYDVLARLARAPEDGRSSEALAAQARVAPAALRRAVEQLTGTTLSTWRARARMSWARRMLREGEPPTRVARRVGYADGAAFTRAFTRAHGRSPKRFQEAELRSLPEGGRGTA